MAIVTDLTEVRRILTEARVIAVLGASPTPRRAGHYVGAYLAEHGYQVHPVNPVRVGTEIWGRPVVATLADLSVEPDLIDVFRRAEHVPAHVPEILAMARLPAVVWLQLGIRHDGAAAELSAAGISVVQDRCTLADHRRFGL